MDYHFAKHVEGYAGAFGKAIPAQDDKPAFACNCILNFLYGKLEGKTTGRITGPITFGEIAHLLLNQTTVQLYLRDVEQRCAHEDIGAMTMQSRHPSSC